MLSFDSVMRHFMTEASIMGEPFSLVLDTGAFSTILSFEFIKRLFKVDEDLLLDFLLKGNCITVYGVGSREHKALPCYIRNVRLGSIDLPRFYFNLSADFNQCLLGWDFIEACTIGKRIGNSFTIKEFDYNRYMLNFLNGLKVEAQELLFADTCSEVNWFDSLSPEHREKLHGYSSPLYAVLSSGNYYEEFGAVLKGFKELYNL